jgi:hypothetical protein
VEKEKMDFTKVKRPEDQKDGKKKEAGGKKRKKKKKKNEEGEEEGACGRDARRLLAGWLSRSHTKPIKGSHCSACPHR